MQGSYALRNIRGGSQHTLVTLTDSRCPDTSEELTLADVLENRLACYITLVRESNGHFFRSADLKSIVIFHSDQNQNGRSEAAEKVLTSSPAACRKIRRQLRRAKIREAFSLKEEDADLRELVRTWEQRLAS